MCCTIDFTPDFLWNIAYIFKIKGIPIANDTVVRYNSQIGRWDGKNWWVAEAHGAPVVVDTFKKTCRTFLQADANTLKPHSKIRALTFSSSPSLK